MNIKTIFIVLYLLKKAVMSVVYIKMAYRYYKKKRGAKINE
jgi:hypothetical protein